jgi:hypothetical protein
MIGKASSLTSAVCPQPAASTLPAVADAVLGTLAGQ